jgi:hypothetical protein
MPEFPARAAKLNSNYVPTESLLADERYAASLMFLGGQIYHDEMLTALHSCG